MANKNFLKAVLGTAGMLAAALVLGMAVAGCDDGTQDVNVLDKKTDGPSNVKAIQTTDKNFVILSWDAASGASNYSVYYQKDGKKTINPSYGAYPETTLLMPRIMVMKVILMMMINGQYVFLLLHFQR
jgi:hypothetical protein